MTENRQSMGQAVPAAWKGVLTQMGEEYAAKEVSAQMQEMRGMLALVQARTAPCRWLKLDHARRKMAGKGAKRVLHLRWINQYEPAERVLEATISYMKMLNILAKPEVQGELTDEEFANLMDQLTEECLFVIDNPDIWPA